MKLSLKTRMAREISRNKNRNVFIRADFKDKGTPSRITRALQDLTSEGRIIRLGYGIYAKARPSLITGEPVPYVPLELLATEAFDRLGIDIEAGLALEDYERGDTTQIPVNPAFRTRGKRISRKISLGGREVIYEKNLARAS